MHIPKSAAVSVVIPCHNSSKTLLRSVNSVLAQTLLPNELILVDDCSNDDGATIQIINELSVQFPKEINLKIIFKNLNTGPASSRNLGWQSAKNTFIAFLDSDDIWHPQKIELQYFWMINNQQVLFTSHYTALFNHKTDLNKIFPKEIHTCKLQPFDLLWFNPICTRGVMLKKDIALRFPENMYYAEDFFLWTEIVSQFPDSCFILKYNLAFSFKNDFGEGGLSSNLLQMEKGELSGISNLCKKMDYNVFIKYAAYIFSILKYLRRCVKVAIKKMKKADNVI